MEASTQTGLDLEREKTQGLSSHEGSSPDGAESIPTQCKPEQLTSGRCMQAAAPELSWLQTASRRGWPAPEGTCPSEPQNEVGSDSCGELRGSLFFFFPEETFEGSDRTTSLTPLCKHLHHGTDGNGNSWRLALRNSGHEVLGS